MATVETPSAAAAQGRRCENCGELLLGEHCYHCGQPTKGLVRHFSSILGDFFDTVLNIDSRVLRTLGPLLSNPGFLSLEYFAGRRVRYVTPMRLYLFMSVLAFFSIQASIDFNDDNTPLIINDSPDQIASAKTPEQVRALADKAVAKLEQTRKQLDKTPAAGIGIDLAKAKVRERAQQQIKLLKAAESARANGTPVPESTPDDDGNLNFTSDGKPWDPVTNPLVFDWLPASANTALNRRIGHARDVLKANNNQKPIFTAMFNVLPQTLFVLMPLFALMLKIAYWFKRRLYMEHLIVALHSHSFIALALVVILMLKWLQSWLAPTWGFFNGCFGWAIGLSIAWIPIYLLLMQKRVYRQGWVMTLLKYGVIGICYSILLSLGLAAAILIGLLTL